MARRDRRGGANCFQEKTETRHYLGTGCILLCFTFHEEYSWKNVARLERKPALLEEKKKNAVLLCIFLSVGRGGAY